MPGSSPALHLKLGHYPFWKFPFWKFLDLIPLKC